MHPADWLAVLHAAPSPDNQETPDNAQDNSELTDDLDEEEVPSTPALCIGLTANQKRRRRKAVARLKAAAGRPHE